MFLGEYEHTIDDKGRITIPARFRPELAPGLVVTRGLDGCLFVYPTEEWAQLAERINALPLTQRDARTFTRLMYSGAAHAEPDRQGRVLIPQYLREFAGIEAESVVIGLYSRIEIWNPDRWREVRRKAEEEGDAIAEQLANLGI